MSRSAGPVGPQIENVVVLLVDTLRADHLSLYGYERPTSPTLDRRAAEGGIVFDDVRAQSPCTFPSVNSLLTSRSPTVFLAGLTEHGFAIPPEVPTLARRLKNAGFSTLAVSSSPIVRATPSEENQVGGFGDGFDTFDEFCRWREAECVINRARPQLETLEEPFFAYLHFLEPHDPYRPQPFPNDAHPFATAPPTEADKEWVRQGDPRPLSEFLFSGGPDPGTTPADLAHLVALYDEEILYWDQQLDHFFAILEARQLLERTAVIVVADHGEEFLEHGSAKHCRTLYDTEVRVPMVLLLPGREPRRIATPVSNLDLVPTVLDLVGVDARPEGIEGRSLRPLFEGRPDPSLRGRSQFAAYGRLRAVVAARLKLVQNLRDRNLELYDLDRDPGEQRDLSREDLDRVRALRSRLRQWRRETEPAAAEAKADEAEKALRSVGYID